MAAIETSTLPSPEEVAETFEQMRSAVLAADDGYAETIAEAQAMIDEAEAERRTLRERYPMFFVEEQRRSPGGGQPSIAQMNQLLRTISERPDQTIRQLARRLNYSESWTKRIIRALDERDERGRLLQREKHGRSFVYRLTADGNHVLNRGGIRE